jgi:hypothetical protein
MKLAGQFAWLSIDSDNPANAGFTDKYAGSGVPLFLIIDSRNERVVLSWYGTATAPQLAQLMDDGRRAIGGGLTGADAWLARADEMNGQKKLANAARFYEQALQAGGDAWPHRTRTIESLVMALLLGGDRSRCIEVAAREAPTMARDRSFVNTVDVGLNCAQPGTPELMEMEKLAEEGVRSQGVLADDISGLYGDLAGVYRRDKEAAAATRTANAWLRYLQEQIAHAPNAEARVGYDFHLVSAAMFLGHPEIALPEIRRTEHELPNDYNPPRLAARLYLQLGRLDDALAAIDRSLAKAYGTPRLRVYSTKADILIKKGNLRAARATYAEAIAFGRTLPPGAESEIEALQKDLAAAQRR